VLIHRAIKIPLILLSNTTHTTHSFEHFLASSTEGGNPQTVDDFFARADTNADGELSPGELEAAFETYVTVRGGLRPRAPSRYACGARAALRYMRS
jgi:hypothetical protein